MKNFFTKRKIIIGASVLVALAIAVYTNSAIFKTETPTAASANEQVYAAVKSNVILTPMSNENLRDATAAILLEGQLPVKVISSTEMLDILRQSNALSYATINVGRNLFGVVETNVNDETEIIYLAYFIEEQRPTIVELLSEKDILLTVIPGSTNIQAAPTYNNYGAASPYTSTSTGQSQPISPYLLLGVLVNLAFLGLIFFFIFRFFKARGSFGTGIAKKKNEVVEAPETRFTDVAGCDEAIEDMQELVEFLKDPSRFKKTGAKPPRGALLVGPPGTGKTLLARAVAGEAGVPFYSAAGSDFVEMYVGVGAKRIRELFAKAKKHEEGAIIFIDEIDAVGRARASRNDVSNNTEGENTLNALLVEMDGFEASKVIVLGATNREDMLDKALTRPGRLDRKIQVPLPDRVGRIKILQVHASNKPFEGNVDWDLVARRTPGMSGAELASVVNEACLVAAREHRDTVSNKDLDAAIATVAMGKPRHSAIVSEHDRLVTAWHEAGHTVVAMILPDADDPVSVSIIPRGPAGGVTWMSQGDDIFLTRKRAFARLVVAMGGRAAEEMLLDGEFTSGPHGDLTAATQTALAMVTQYGMTDMGLMVRSEGFLSTGAKLTDDTVVEVEKLLAEALNFARETLRSHRELLTHIVEELLENDTLTQEDLLLIKSGRKFTPPILPGAPKNYVRVQEKSNNPTKPQRRRATRIEALMEAIKEGSKVFYALKPKRKI